MEAYSAPNWGRTEEPSSDGDHRAARAPRGCCGVASRQDGHGSCTVLLRVSCATYGRDSEENT